LADKALADYVPPGLADATTSAAAALAAGKPTADIVSNNVAALMSAAAQSLLWTKLQVASAVLMVLIAMGLGVGALLPSATAGKKDNHQAEAVVRERVTDCVLHAIDPEAMTIQAAHYDEAAGGVPVLQEFHVQADAAIVVNGRNLRLTDLKAGDCVNITVE